MLIINEGILRFFFFLLIQFTFSTFAGLTDFFFHMLFLFADRCLKPQMCILQIMVLEV